MRDHNTMTKWGYILENVFWAILGVHWYKQICFANFLELDDEFSKLILYLIVGIFVLIGILLTLKHRRNSVNTFVNIVFPFSVYTAIAYINYLRPLIIILFVLAVVISILYVIMTKRYSYSSSSRKQKHFSFGRFSILGTRTIITSCAAIVIVYLFASTVTGIQLFRPESETPENSVPSFVEYYENNAETFDKLEQHTWSKLSTGEKLDVLQVVCNAEKAKLGIQEPIQIKSKLFQSNLLGEYIYKDNTVLINTKHLEEDSSYSILETVTHECYHSYERSLVKLYNSVSDEEKNLMAFSRAKHYKEEFANYKDGDSEGYYWQTVEIDARDYSEEAAKDYKRKIQAHLEYS